jgi:hypothetical protein
VHSGSVWQPIVAWARHQCCRFYEWDVDHCRSGGNGHDYVVTCTIPCFRCPHRCCIIASVHSCALSNVTVFDHSNFERRDHQARNEISSACWLMYVWVILWDAIWALCFQYRTAYVPAAGTLVRSSESFPSHQVQCMCPADIFSRTRSCKPSLSPRPFIRSGCSRGRDWGPRGCGLVRGALRRRGAAVAAAAALVGDRTGMAAAGHQTHLPETICAAAACAGGMVTQPPRPAAAA